MPEPEATPKNTLPAATGPADQPKAEKQAEPGPAKQADAPAPQPGGPPAAGGQPQGPDWRRKFDDDAWRQIKQEGGYLFGLLVLIPLIMLVIWACYEWVSRQMQPVYQIFTYYSFTWLGGMLGGTVFGAKWLCHGVAEGKWSEGHRVWRFLNPFISAAVAVAFVLLIKSGIISVFDKGSLNSLAAVTGFSFLAGYFSDKVTLKLAEVAKTLFGETEQTEFGDKKKGGAQVPGGK